MKTFHVSIVYITPTGFVTKSHTFKAATPADLDYQTAFMAEYDRKSDEHWVSIETVQVKETVELALAN